MKLTLLWITLITIIWLSGCGSSSNPQDEKQTWSGSVTQPRKVVIKQNNWEFDTQDVLDAIYKNPRRNTNSSWSLTVQYIRSSNWTQNYFDIKNNWAQSKYMLTEQNTYNTNVLKKIEAKWCFSWMEEKNECKWDKARTQDQCINRGIKWCNTLNIMSYESYPNSKYFSYVQIENTILTSYLIDASQWKVVVKSPTCIHNLWKYLLFYSCTKGSEQFLFDMQGGSKKNLSSTDFGIFKWLYSDDNYIYTLQEIPWSGDSAQMYAIVYNKAFNKILFKKDVTVENKEYIENR